MSYDVKIRDTYGPKKKLIRKIRLASGISQEHLCTFSRINIDMVKGTSSLQLPTMEKKLNYATMEDNEECSHHFWFSKANLGKKINKLLSASFFYSPKLKISYNYYIKTLQLLHKKYT